MFICFHCFYEQLYFYVPYLGFEAASLHFRANIQVNYQAKGKHGIF
jgi:hypothetical protein